MIFKTEAEFETAMIAALQNKGWGNHVLKHPTEEDLLKNWANILFENNRGIDRLNDAPLNGNRDAANFRASFGASQSIKT